MVDGLFAEPDPGLDVTVDEVTEKVMECLGEKSRRTGHGNLDTKASR